MGIKLEIICFSDINECVEWGYCDQGCQNHRPGFTCSCLGECYHLEMMHGPGNDNHTLRGYCLSRDSGTMRLYIARREGLYRYFLLSNISSKKW